MATQIDDLTEQLFSLPPEDRLTIAQRLWDSLDPELQSQAIEVDEELIAEIERRDAEMEGGTVKTYTHEEVMVAARKAIEEHEAKLP